MSSENAVQIMHMMPWFGWVAIVAIISGAVTQIVGMSHRHRERIEMIRQGMNPDGGKPSTVDL